MKRFEIITCISLLTTFFLSLIRFWNNIDYWFVDILSHFSFQYLLITLVILMISIWVKRASLIILSLLLFLFNFWTLVGFGGDVQAIVQDSGAFKVYSANINRNNREFDKLRQELYELDAEIVVLIEVTPEHLTQLKPVIQKFPYHIEFTPVGSLDLGIVLLSEFPILDYNHIQLSKVGNALLETTLNIYQKKVAFFALHSQSPVHIKEFQSRKRQLLWLSNRIAETSMPVIVAGDFNATPYSPIFRRFIEISGLKDSSNGFGWLPSWPSYLTFLGLPIDHILVSPEIQIHKRIIGSEIGSDHYPVIAELSI